MPLPPSSNLLASLPARLSPRGFAAAMDEGALVLDTRDATAYSAAHIPGAVHIGLDEHFASWARLLVPADQPVILVTADLRQLRKNVEQLTAAGRPNATGWLDGGMSAWTDAGRETASTEEISAAQLQTALPRVQVLDVRAAGAFSAGHLAGAVNVPLESLPDAGNAGFAPSAPTVVVCDTGYRSSIATSLLERQGFDHLARLAGGLEAWAAAGLPLVTPATPRG